MKLAIVVPCYNEEEVLPTTAQTLQKVLQELIDDHEIDRESKIYFVDDGSTDKTWSLITELTQKNHAFLALNFQEIRAINLHYWPVFFRPREMR